jgi:hypothetical protein
VRWGEGGGEGSQRFRQTIPPARSGLCGGSARGIMSASNGRSVGAGKTFTARDIAKSKVAKHLSDPFTARDLFGVVRAHCLAPGCECAEYWKATKDYTVRPAGQGRRHLTSRPDNHTSAIASVRSTRVRRPRRRCRQGT